MNQESIANFKAYLRRNAEVLATHQQAGLSASDAMNSLIDMMIGRLEDAAEAPEGRNEAEGTVYKAHGKGHTVNLSIRIQTDGYRATPNIGTDVTILWSKKQ